MTPLLAVEGVDRSFGATKALHGVSLSVFPGEVHALVGENGAGKSTLMKVLSGALQPDGGRMTLDGEVLRLPGPQAGREAGVAMIYQELNLAPHLTVEENVMLGIERSRFGFVRSDAGRVGEALALLGHHDIPARARVGQLTIGRQQLVEVARAIVSEARVIIMDEPTSSLSDEDKQALYKVIGLLRDRGLAIIYISHFLDEVREVCDRYTVLRDGETVGTGMVADVTMEQIVEMMMGRSVENVYPQRDHAMGDVVLRADSVSGVVFPKEATFALRRGEIFGIYGLVGSGRSELARCVFGLDPVVSGTLQLGRGVRLSLAKVRPQRALRVGLDYLSENRKEEGLAPDLTIGQNVTLSALAKESRGGCINLGRERSIAEQWVEALRIKCRDPADPIGSLSGGNQQKVAIARMMNHDSDVFLMDEPTRGIDVGSKLEIYQLILDLATGGKSLFVISSYLPELQGICDTLAVMHRGRLSPKRDVSDWEGSEIMIHATTGWDEKPFAGGGNDG